MEGLNTAKIKKNIIYEVLHENQGGVSKRTRKLVGAWWTCVHPEKTRERDIAPTTNKVTSNVWTAKQTLTPKI